MNANSLPVVKQMSVPTVREVTESDLANTRDVEAILRALNDPYVSLQRLAILVEAVPVLMARCQREAFFRKPDLRKDAAEQALRIIGNKGLEKALLDVLEEMTVLKSSLTDDE